jgi:NarL family two-component system response regulator LiaR
VPDPIGIALADDHAVVREGLRAFLAGQPDLAVVGEASTGTDLLALVARCHPDVVLIDLLMPGMDGIETIRRLTAIGGDIPRIVVLTSSSARAHVAGALAAGALSYVLKDAAPHAIADAIRAAVRGRAVLPASLERTAVRDLAATPGRRGSGFIGLTAREIEVLRCLAEGLSNAVIAGRLTVTEGTVKTHVASILAKLDVNDRTQAAVFAWREGLVDR